MNLGEVARHLSPGRPGVRTQDGWKVMCPAHDDREPSLHVSAGDDGRILLHCHAGCNVEDVLTAGRLTWADLMPPRQDRPQGGGETVYPYYDEQGTELYQVVRKPPKRFMQRRQVDGEWVWSLNGTRRVIYRLPQVIEAVAGGKPVWVAEGEKDADALVEAGVCATTNPGGAGKWRDDYNAWFEGAEVTIVRDPDQAGQEHARQVKAALSGVAASVRIVEAAAGKDAYDHLRVHRKGLGDFVEVEGNLIEGRLIPRVDLDDYVDQVLPEQRFAIPGALAESEIAMVTGFEGHGKSYLLKQVAAMLAYGVHPFRVGEQIEPRRVLYVDAENATRDSREDFEILRRLGRTHTRAPQRAPLTIVEPGVIDLMSPVWAAWLVDQVRMTRPDLLVMGPVYKLVGRDLRDEDSARALMRVITEAQTVNACPVLLEHHVAKANNGERGLDPLGSGLFLRWCNVILGMRELTVDIGSGRHTGTGYYSLDPVRRPRRRNRSWPTHLRKGVPDSDEWPWEVCEQAEVEAELSRARTGRETFAYS